MAPVRQWTGRESRALRHAMRLSVRDFAARLGVVVRSITKWEAQRERASLRPDSQALLDTLLHQAGDEERARFELLLGAPSRRPSAGQELAFRRTVGIEDRPPSGSRTRLLDDGDHGSVEEDMRRRDLFGYAALSVTGVATLAAMEALRHDVIQAVAGDAFADPDEWEQVAWDYGYAYSVTPPKALLDDLAADLLVARRQLDQTTDESARRDLQRVIARLSAFVALCCSDLGNLQAGHRWWRTARLAADAAADPEIQVWVRGRELVQGLYEHRPITAMLDLADEADSLQAPPGIGTNSILAGRAQAMAMMGRPVEANGAMEAIYEAFPRLPSRVVEDTATTYGWSEFRLRHTESFVYTHLGDVHRAEAAQELALALYPAHRFLARAQVQLHQAMCMVNSGDVSAGAGHAQQVIAGLPEAHRSTDMLELARSVVRVVPAAERQRPNVTALREIAAFPTAPSL